MTVVVGDEAFHLSYWTVIRHFCTMGCLRSTIVTLSYPVLPRPDGDGMLPTVGSLRFESRGVREFGRRRHLCTACQEQILRSR